VGPILPRNYFFAFPAGSTFTSFNSFFRTWKHLSRALLQDSFVHLKTGKKSYKSRLGNAAGFEITNLFTRQFSTMNFTFFTKLTNFRCQTPHFNANLSLHKYPNNFIPVVLPAYNTYEDGT
jgi:hypothetical protein